jgi:hypothetical protein
MAKYSRFDPRNKKSGKHKQQTKEGFQFKRIKDLVKKGKATDYENYEKETFRTQGD